MSWETSTTLKDKKKIGFSDKNLAIKISWDHLECFLPQSAFLFPQKLYQDFI